MSGSVHERALSDGRAEVTVILHTKNALIWVMPWDWDTCCDFLNDPLVFGYRAQDIAADATLQPGLAESHLQVVFKNTAPGDDLPDIVDAFIIGSALEGQEIVSLSFSATGNGPLREEFGVADGTPGKAVVRQTGVLFRGLSDPGQWKGARADGYPVEMIELRVVGQ